MALRLRRGTTAELALITPQDGELLYDVSTKSLYIGDGTTAGGKLLASGGTILEDIVLNGNDITGTGDIDITGDIDVAGSIHATGNITADGDITLGAGGDDTVSFDAKVDTDIIPETSANIDLGSDSNRWVNVYAITVDANNLIGNTVGYHTGDVQGSVFADSTSPGNDSTPLVDAVAGKIVGPVETTTVSASSGITGNLTGNVAGNVQGDVIGNVQGNVTGVFVGELRSSTGVVVGDTGDEDFAQFRANVAGDLYGSVFADTTGVGAGAVLLIDGSEGTINLNSTINDHIVSQVDAQHDVGSRSVNFRNAYVSDRVYFDNIYDIQLSQDLTNSVETTISFKGGSANRLPVTTTITGNITGTVSAFQVADARGIRPGAIFSIPGMVERTVDTVNSGTGAITSTEPFSVSGSTDGLIVVFYNPPEVTTTYKASAPTAAVGNPGDVKGMVFADANFIYVCTANYNGVTDIWVRSTAGTWI
jgi:hypothetical protein